MKNFWIWGLFSEKENDLLSKIKGEVQIDLISPKFDLHITLAGPYLQIDKHFVSKLKKFGDTNYSIFLNLNKYDFRTDKFKSFYISINNSDQLKNIRNKIFELKRFDLETKYFPHISLAYGNHEIKEKKELISKLPKLNKIIMLSKIALFEVHEDVKLSRIIQIYKLH